VDEIEFKRRTRQLSLDVIGLVERLPRNRSCDVIGRQLIRSATSVAANYRASCRARSYEEIIAKLGIVEEEGDETMFWLELLERSGHAPAAAIAPLHRETNEVLAMVVASQKTLKRRIGSPTFDAPRVRTRIVSSNRESRIVNRESP
jgi:four helix bundle protein